MPKLSLIESEATRLLRRMPETSRRALQQELLDLCEAHWPELRGPEPATRLAHALWLVAPPCADLLADLVAANDARLQGLLGTQPAHAFALLALAEIERGNVEGVRLAHAPMMLFATPAAGVRYAAAVAAALRGGGTALHQHPHASKPPLWKALAAMVAGSGRCDLAAALAMIGVLVARPPADAPPDATLEALRGRLAATGVHFIGIDDGHVSLAVHGQPQPQVSIRQLAELLGEIRQAWLA